MKRDERLKELEKKRNKLNEEIEKIYHEIETERKEQKRKRIDGYFKKPYYAGKITEKGIDLLKYYDGEEVLIKLCGLSIDGNEARCAVIWKNGIDFKTLPLFSATLSSMRRLFNKENISSDAEKNREWLIDTLTNIDEKEFMLAYKDKIEEMREWIK